MKNLKFIITSLFFIAFNLVSAFSFTNDKMPGPQLSFDEIVITTPNTEIRNEIINLIGNHEFEYIVDVKTRLEFTIDSNGTIDIVYINLDHYDYKKIKSYLMKKLQNKTLTFHNQDNKLIYHLPLTFKKRP